MSACLFLRDRLNLRWVLGGLLLWVAVGGFGMDSEARAQAPVVSSFTPAEGATDITIDTPIVITFDRDMDTTVAVLSSLNLTMSPASIPFIQGTWAEDKRTLTLKPSFGNWPLNITIQWTLNPAGSFAFLQIKSAAGVALGTVSGSFSTGLGAPAMGSVSPANDDEAVPTNSLVTFRFTQPMKKIELPGGNPPSVVWIGAGLDPAKFRYTWSADGRSLTAEYSGGFPRKTRVDWTLNPEGAMTPFESQTGKPLPKGVYQGGFNTAATGTCSVVSNPTWGSYGVNKRSHFVQTSPAAPVEDPEAPAAFVFSAVLQSPAFGPNVTAGSIELPNGTRTSLTNFGVFTSFYETAATEAAMDAAYPPGTYTLRFTQTGLPERVVAMNMTESDVPPIPTIANFAEAQAVDASQDFSLRWGSFSNGDSDDLISVFLFNEDGKVVFQAPDYCLPLPLLPTDTSIVIPANTLIKDRTYSAELLMGKSFYSSTNTFPEMSGYGYRLRSTQFTVKTGAGTNPDLPPVLSAARVQPDGKAAFDLSGTAARTYGIQRSDTLDAATWPEVGTAVTDGSGAATFVDSQALGNGPRFYRAVPK